MKIKVILKAQMAVEIDVSEDAYESFSYDDLANMAKEKAGLDSTFEWEFETLILDWRNINSQE